MRKSSLTDELFFLPWWVSMTLGGSIYLLLRFVLPEVGTDNPIQETLFNTLSKMAGMIALLFVMVAFFAALRQFKSGTLFHQQATSPDLNALTWLQFEQLIGEAYRREGYQVSGNVSQGSDGGVDLDLRKAGEKVLVQCKHWKSSKVGVKVVRELYGVVAKERADRGIVVCSGEFTADAIAFAKGLPLELVGGRELKRLIVLPKNTRKQAVVEKKQATDARLLCPTCGGAMVKRKALKGKYAGQSFMGCKAFPKCRGIRKA